MKLKGFFSFATLFILSFFVFSLQMVSAQTLSDGLERFVSDAEPILRFLLGDVSSTGNFNSSQILFVKLLVFILLVSIVHIVLKQTPFKFGEDSRITILIAFLVSLLSVRYLTEGALLSTIWLPYGVMGILLSSLLPFIIAFFFLQSFNSSFLRKTGWTLFAMIFFALAYLRWDDLTLDANGFNLAWIYIGVAIAAVIIYFRDRSLHALFLVSEINRIADVNKKLQAIGLQQDITELQNKLVQNLTPDQRSTVEHALRQKIKALKSLMSS